MTAQTDTRPTPFHHNSIFGDTSCTLTPNHYTAIPAPLPQPHVSGISSPSLATPRPHSITLQPIVLPDSFIAVSEALKMANANANAGTGVLENANGHGDRPLVDGEQQSSFPVTDGRSTPLADSASSASPRDPPSPNPTTISSFSQTTQSSHSQPTFTANISHPAEIGLGNLQGEEQLKTALQSKDRLFLLVLAKELEAFVRNVAAGQALPTSQNLVQGATTSALAALGPSTQIAAVATSKFQRMLVYKAAEWYGLKAVPGPEGTMIVGVLGVFNEKSVELQLSKLVPAAPSPTQKFRIMQRAQPSSAGSADGTSENGGSDSRQPRAKTLAEREAAYALAKEKIYGKSAEMIDSNDSSRIDGDRDRHLPQRKADDDDEFDLVPRRRPPNTNDYDNVVYPSLYHPAKAETAPPIAPAVQDQYPIQHPGAYSYQPNGMTYPAYPQADANGYPIIPNGFPQPTPPMQQPYGAMQQTYMNPVPGYAGQQVQMDAYTHQRWQPNPALNPSYPTQPVPQIQPYNMMPNQQNGNIMGGQGWGYPQMTQANQPMPMIPQGMAYPPPYGYLQQTLPPTTNQPQPQRQPSYPPLMQPTPTRPQPHPHSSASSSISSRSYSSYQSYHDGSRPHSRGSTTSTRSAASSVRLGAIYPANQGMGYRQQGMMGQGLNGLMSTNANGDTRRGHREQSPESTTTTSSRSSRQTSSIQLAQPTQGQHQLPPRPDWAAKNIPYHPSPMLNGPSATEFPPLMGHRHGTNAEPMQVERAKARPTNGGTVWNGSNHIHHNPYMSSNGDIASPAMASPQTAIVPGPSRTPLPPPTAHTTTHQVTSPVDADPDFPRRIQSKTAPTLYDPTAPKTAVATNGTTSRPPSVNHNHNNQSASSQDSVNGASALSPEEIIEAKLAAVSINAGVSIGPPPSRTGTTSYAKIVRRD